MKAHDAIVIGIGGSNVYELVGEKLAYSAFVWQSTRWKNKNQATIPTAQAVAEDEASVEGTMEDGHRFYDWWFEPLARMLATVSKTKSVQQVHEHLKTSAVAEKLEMPWSDVYGEVEITQDCEILSRYIGKTFVWQMVGASYHKVVDENFVVLRGPGGFYSPYLKDASYDPKRGWQQVRCIEYRDNGDAEWRKSLEKMPLMELKNL